MTKIIMHGCNGRIGQAITKLASTREDIEIVAGIDPNLSVSNPYPVFESINACNVKADVIIDFSTAKAVKPLLECAIERSLPIVVCTTGLSDEDTAFISTASRSIPVFFSANMSLGVNLLINLAKRATEILADSGFDIEIIEKHHNQKIDAPSGTALAIAQGITDTLEESYTLRYDRSTVREKRPKNEIGIHAVRGGTIVGEHDIIFAGMDEVITLSHTASSKEVFAVGAIKAATFLSSQASGLYNMQHLLG